MTVLFQDSFNRANGAIGANYTELTGNSTQIVSNVATGNGSGAVSNVWNGSTLADGYAQAKISALPGSGGNFAALSARFATGTFNGYVLEITDTTGAIRRYDAGVGTTLGATFSAPSTGQTVRFSVVGAVLRVYYNGTLQATRVDTAYSAAASFGFGFTTTSSGSFDDFEVGSLASFGQKTPGTGSSPTQDGRWWGSKFTLTEGANIRRAVAFFDFDAGNTSNGGDSAKVAIYADNAGTPGALVAVSSAVAVPGGDVAVEFPISGWLPAGDYWPGVVNNGLQSRLNSTTTGGLYVRQQDLTYASPANPMPDPPSGGPTSGSGNFSVFVEYDAGEEPTLSVSASKRTASVDITAAGATDWQLITGSGPDTFNRKSGGGSLFSTWSYSPVVNGYNPSLPANGFTWSDGTSPASGSGTNGAYNYGNITLTVPADTTTRRVRVYAGTPAGQTIDCNVSLSDSSAGPATVAYSLDGDCTFDIQFCAASAGQTLTITIARRASNYLWVSGAALSLPDATPYLEQARYRWRNDDGSESAATWAAAENTTLALPKNTPRRLRVQVQSTNDKPSASYKLQYRKSGDASWKDIN